MLFQVLQLLISGIAQGCIYGLIALGFVLSQLIAALSPLPAPPTPELFERNLVIRFIPSE